jgi:hypothetical protein
VTNEKVSSETVTFDTIGQLDTNAVVSLLLPKAPSGVMIDGKPADPRATDYENGVLRMRFQNRAQNVAVSVSR